MMALLQIISPLKIKSFRRYTLKSITFEIIRLKVLQWNFSKLSHILSLMEKDIIDKK